VHSLLGALNDDDGDVRRTAAAALGELGSALVAQPLEAALADEDEGVREAARQALAHLRGPNGPECSEG